MESKVIYIAGPVTGVNNYKEQFQLAARTLRRMGYIVLDPTVLPAGMTRPQYMKICYAMIDDADMVLFLYRWQHSIGATGEFDYCNSMEKPYVCCAAPLSVDSGWKDKVKALMEVSDD